MLIFGSKKVADDHKWQEHELIFSCLTLHDSEPCLFVCYLE